jgi:hypothetical protein
MVTNIAVCLASHPKYAGVLCTSSYNHDEQDGHRNVNMQEEKW